MPIESAAKSGCNAERLGSCGKPDGKLQKKAAMNGGRTEQRPGLRGSMRSRGAEGKCAGAVEEREEARLPTVPMEQSVCYSRGLMGNAISSRWEVGQRLKDFNRGIGREMAGLGFA